ncbi:MAG TPA: hypothetical protein VFV66_36235 [Nonomuraea sp.]|nr:hypothetical protein [Nonomuraea sp.]
MDELLARLEHLTDGLNYATTFRLLPLPAGTSLRNAETAIVQVYPEAKLIEPTLVDAATVWEEIDYAFDYRGDGDPGPELTDAQEVELRELQGRYRDYVRSFIGPESAIYLGGFRGLPGYPVFWGFCFLLLNADREGLFLFGTASD